MDKNDIMKEKTNKKQKKKTNNDADSEFSHDDYNHIQKNFYMTVASSTICLVSVWDLLLVRIY